MWIRKLCWTRTCRPHRLHPAISKVHTLNSRRINKPPYMWGELTPAEELFRFWLINQNPVIMRIFTSHSVPHTDYKEALFTACLWTKKKGTRFVYISWSVNCLKILALKEFLKSNFSYLKAFSQTQGDLFSTVRHAMPVLEVLWCPFNGCTRTLTP